MYERMENVPNSESNEQKFHPAEFSQLERHLDSFEKLSEAEQHLNDSIEYLNYLIENKDFFLHPFRFLEAKKKLEEVLGELKLARLHHDNATRH